MFELITDREVLSQKSKPAKVDEESLGILKQMHETILHYRNTESPIAALAANQIGYPYRIIVLCNGDEFVNMFNPEIAIADGSVEIWEGCGSIPSAVCLCERPRFTLVNYTDEKNSPMILPLNELGSHLACHEIDHLDGITILDRSKKTEYVESEKQKTDVLISRNGPLFAELKARQQAEANMSKDAGSLVK
ncbi:MAG: peptide deformylase [Firmicutes bacterium]|nr:peptide deformylase [Bacillota bacterium]